MIQSRIFFLGSLASIMHGDVSAGIAARERGRDYAPSWRRHGGGVAACRACQQPTEERCKNFRSVAVILFERG
jgi:hypothetical protein